MEIFIKYLKNKKNYRNKFGNHKFYIKIKIPKNKTCNIYISVKILIKINKLL